MSADKITRADKFTSSVLLIDSDPLMLTAMSSVLNMHNYRAVMARSEAVALEVLEGPKKESFDLIVMSFDDFELGTQVAARIRKLTATRDLPIIFLVPELSPEWSAKLASLGGIYSLMKPFEPAALVELVQKSLWMPHLTTSRMGNSGKVQSRQRDWISLGDQ